MAMKKLQNLQKMSLNNEHVMTINKSQQILINKSKSWTSPTNELMLHLLIKSWQWTLVIITLNKKQDFKNTSELKS